MPQKVILGILEQKKFFLSPTWWAIFKISFKVIFVRKNSQIIFEKLNQTLSTCRVKIRMCMGFLCILVKLLKFKKICLAQMFAVTMNLLNQGYRLYLDNYYTKAELFFYFYDKKTYGTGTTRADQGFMQAILMSITQYKKLNLSIFLNLNIYFCLLVCLFRLLVFCFWYWSSLALELLAVKTKSYPHVSYMQLLDYLNIHNITYKKYLNIWKMKI